MQSIPEHSLARRIMALVQDDTKIAEARSICRAVAALEGNESDWSPARALGTSVDDLRIDMENAVARDPEEALRKSYELLVHMRRDYAEPPTSKLNVVASSARKAINAMKEFPGYQVGKRLERTILAEHRQRQANLEAMREDETA